MRRPRRARARTLASLALVQLLAVASASAATAQPVEEQVRTEVRRYVDAVNRGDPRVVAALYLSDPRTSSLGDGQIYRGSQAIAELLQEVYSQGAISMTVDSVSVLPLGTDAAVAVMRYRWVIGRESAESLAGALTLVYRRTPQGWRVAHDHTSTLAPHTPGPGAAGEPADSGPRNPVRETSSCRVVRIVDGDTIECARAGRVRLIGIDTPELVASFLRQLYMEREDVPPRILVPAEPTDREVLEGLGDDGIVLSKTGAALRGAGPGASLRFGQTSLTVRGVVTDAALGGREAVVTRQTGTAIGVNRSRYLLVDLTPGEGTEALEAALKATMPAEQPLRLRGVDEPGIAPRQINQLARDGQRRERGLRADHDNLRNGLLQDDRLDDRAADLDIILQDLTIGELL